MSSKYTSAAEDAITIRQAFKLAGIKASVRSEQYSGGSSIHVRVKKGSVQEAKAIAQKCEKISRCKASGEILNGGNRYVSVSASETLLDEIMQIIWNAGAEAVRDAFSFEYAGRHYKFIRSVSNIGESHYYLQTVGSLTLEHLSKYSTNLQHALEAAAEKIA
jgi:hypothetical protein